MRIVEYSDFQCPCCRRDVPVIKNMLPRYPGQVRMILKQTPLPIHSHAHEALLMSEAVLRHGSRPIEAFDRIIARILATNATPAALARPERGPETPSAPR